MEIAKNFSHLFRCILIHAEYKLESSEELPCAFNLTQNSLKPVFKFKELVRKMIM